MDTTRWQRIQELFHQALNLKPDERGDFLDEVCAGDATLRRELLDLLAADEGATGFFGGPAASNEDGGGEGQHLGEVIGPYRLTECLGEGGMGVVYLAERADGEFEQRVAIKLVRAPWTGPQLVERFLAERRILAKLEHVHIARLLDGGTTKLGQPYLVMEYVEGEPIDDYCERNELSTRKRLGLFLKVCDAVSHAHGQLVVHRDLKPGNIVVNADGAPKLLDFGIAKLMDAEPGAAKLTAVQGQALTPEYASPEQVRGEPVGTASDVYSLGILLYELLAGAPPYKFDTRTPLEIEKVVCDTNPSPPSSIIVRRPRLERELEGDLDTIVMTALRKTPGNRYPSVAALAGDIRAHLESRPVSARPASRRYVAMKFFRRHRASVTAAAGATLAVIAGAAMAVWGMVQAQTERDRAQIEALRAEQSSAFVSNMLSSIDPSYARGADTELIRRVLDDAAVRAPRELAGQPDVLGEIEYVIGRTYMHIGKYDPAREHLTAAEALVQTDTSANKFLNTHMALARIEERTINTKVALKRGKSAMGAVRGQIPADDPAWLDALSYQAGLLAKTGKLDEAVAMLDTVLERTADATESPLIHIRLHGAIGNLVWVLSDLGDFERSERLYEQGLGEAENWDDPSAPRALIRLVTHQALSLQNQQRHVEAEELLRKALALEEAYYGSDHHPMMVTTVIKLASTLRSLGRLDEARPVYERAAAMAEEGFGPDAPMTVVTRNNFGNLLRDLGDAQAAVETQREALAAAESAFPPGHVVHGIFRLELGQSELALGNRERAVDLIREAYDRLLEARGEDYHHTREARQALEEAEQALAASYQR